MGLAQTVTALFLAVALAALAGFALPSAKRLLSNRCAWGAIAIGGLALSAASWFIAEERMGGTLLMRRHGWPKDFSLVCLSPECDISGPTFSLLYFLGNSFVYAAALLLVWTLVAVLMVFLNKLGSTPGP